MNRFSGLNQSNDYISTGRGCVNIPVVKLFVNNLQSYRNEYNKEDEVYPKKLEPVTDERSEIL